MKQFFSLNILTCLPSIAALILASEAAIANPNINPNQVANTRPFNLVRLGYQGYFQDSGIPAYQAFRTAIKYQRVTATKLIESAMEKGRLPLDTLNNQGYVNSVKAQLELILRR